MADSESASERAKPTFELPVTESPSISPANTERSIESDVEPTPETPAQSAEEETPSAVAGPKDVMAIPQIEIKKRLRFVLRPRHKRHALLAASIAIAAAFGAVVGAATTGGFSGPKAADVSMEENKATQQSVTHLAKEIANIKMSLDAASKSANSQIAKISERLGRDGVDATGSVAPPQAASPAPRPSAIAAELQPPRLPIVTDWSIREARGGYIYVQGHGDVYQVVPGAPLPGLGPVEQIKRQDGRWLVVTPRGIIVSMRDRRYFEQF